jgi:ketosteroid isomerase-like protein
MISAGTRDTKTLVSAYYQAGVQGILPAFGPYLHPDFAVTAPNYLPWGGTHHGADFFRDAVLEHLHEVLDFQRFRYDVFITEGDQAVALIDIGVVGTDRSVKISEHWTVKDGRAMSLWVAYFEPQPLLDKLGIKHGLGG